MNWTRRDLLASGAALLTLTGCSPGSLAAMLGGAPATPLPRPPADPEPRTCSIETFSDTTSNVAAESMSQQAGGGNTLLRHCSCAIASACSSSGAQLTCTCRCRRPRPPASR